MRESQRHALPSNKLFVDPVPRYQSMREKKKTVGTLFKTFHSSALVLLLDLKKQFGHFSKYNYNRG